jgi:hypothetical protein
MAEAELNQVIAHPAGHHVAAGVHVRHDGVAVVFQLERTGDVMELDGRERLVQVSAANVEGRLFMALRAGLVRRVEPAPDERSGLALVAPICGLRGDLRGGKCGHAQCKGGKCGKTHEDLLNRDGGC